MQEWSLVVYLFRWLKIQTTFKIDSIPCNCVCIFKKFSKQYCLDYYIKRRGSSFTETYRVFCERRKRVFTTSTTIMNRWNRDVRPSGMHLMFWTRCILSFQHFWTERFTTPNLLHSRKKCPLLCKTRWQRSREHSVGFIFICLRVLQMKQTVLYFQ